MTSLSFVTLNERVYKYIRQFTIKTVEDALVELITNCIDAYNKDSIVPRKVFMGISGSTVRVTDWAIGLTGEQMRKCFLQVGDYTNIESSRGFFSRGAKDISAIGDITFHAVRDGLYSRIFLNSDAYGEVQVSDQVVTEEVRAVIGIPVNGLTVDIKLLPSIGVPGTLASSLSKLAVLRDIMSDGNNEIYWANNRLSYTLHESDTLLELTYQVPNYPEYSAQFNVYKSKTIIPQPLKENELEFGFLIKDAATVYQVSTIDDRFRWNPYMPYVWGYLKCDGIGKLLREYDTTGPTTLNPMPIIDPSRLTGINLTHPFIQGLLSIPKVRLDQILRELNTTISNKSLSLSDMNDLFEELSKYGLNFIETNDIKLKFTPSYDHELAKAIEDDRMNYVQVEKNYMISGNYTLTQNETDNYIKEKIKLAGPSDFYVADNDILIPIPANVKNETPETIMALNPDIESVLTKRPYIYSLGPNGDLQKLYIFEKGRLESVTNPEDEYVTLKQKMLKIEFFNNINFNQRYVIEQENGIIIKLNIHNTSISKYLASDENNLNITNITSVKSLVFFKELMIEVLSEIIVENDILNNKLILDSGNYGNMKKVLLYRNQTVSKIEDSMNAIFDKYINDNLNKKTVTINEILQSISVAVGSKIDLEHNGQDIVMLKKELDEKLNIVIE